MRLYFARNRFGALPTTTVAVRDHDSHRAEFTGQAGGRHARRVVDGTTVMITYGAQAVLAPPAKRARAAP